MRRILLVVILLSLLGLACTPRRVVGVRPAQLQAIEVELPRPGSLQVNVVNALPPNFNIVVQGQRVDPGRDVMLELSGLPGGEFEVSLVAKIFEDDALIGVVVEEFKIREGIGKIQPWIIDRVE